MRKYGMVNGRFRPVHFGHIHIVNEILLAGLIPIIVVGSCNSTDKVRNPLNFEQVVTLWRYIYPNDDIIFIPMDDYESNLEWFETLMSHIPEYETVLFYHNKDEDIFEEFIVGNTIYRNCPYTVVFENTNLEMRQVEFAGRTDIHISASATDIRSDIEAFKHLLDARVYHQLKEWGWK
jgi:nicotinamide mononucleotide adenylyltransferase